MRLLTRDAQPPTPHEAPPREADPSTPTRPRRLGTLSGVIAVIGLAAAGGVYLGVGSSPDTLEQLATDPSETAPQETDPEPQDADAEPPGATTATRTEREPSAAAPAGPDGDGWATVSVKGLSLALPPGMRVELDHREAASRLEELGDEGFAGIVEMFREQPEFFVLLAHQDPAVDDAANPQLVFVGTFPSNGRTAREIGSIEGLLEAGATVHYAEDEVVGTGDYLAWVRLFSYPGGPTAVGFMIVEGETLWTLDYTLGDDLEGSVAVVEESVASLTLP